MSSAGARDLRVVPLVAGPDSPPCFVGSEKGRRIRALWSLLRTTEVRPADYGRSWEFCQPETCATVWLPWRMMNLSWAHSSLIVSLPGAWKGTAWVICFSLLLPRFLETSTKQ